MSQESDTENNSSDKPKKRLSLKRGAGNQEPKATPPPVARPSPPPAPAADEAGKTAKPFRMGLKRREDDTTADEPKAAQVPPAPPTEDHANTFPSIEPVDEPPAQEQPAPPETVEAAAPPPVPKPVEAAPKNPTPRPATRPPVPPGGSRPPLPPPGFKIRKDEDDDAPEAQTKDSALPPPIKPSNVAPLPTPDLMEEVIEQAEKKSAAGRMAKGLLVGVVILLVLGAGVYFLIQGVLGFLDQDTEASVSEPAPPAAVEGGALGLARQTVARVNEKASTADILDTSDSPRPTPTTPVPAPAPPSPSTNDAPVAVAPPTAPATTPPPSAPRQAASNPAIRSWIEGIRPTGIGRGQMILDGERYRLGEVVNAPLGVRWVDLDIQLGVLTFEDANGVRYEKDF